MFHIEENVSRRITLSIISEILDPPGLFAPVLITGQILLRDFWKENKLWDDLTTNEITKALACKRIPRANSEEKLDSISAVGDASEKAYCAAQ